MPLGVSTVKLHVLPARSRRWQSGSKSRRSEQARAQVGKLPPRKIGVDNLIAALAMSQLKPMRTAKRFRSIIFALEFSASSLLGKRDLVTITSKKSVLSPLIPKGGLKPNPLVRNCASERASEPKYPWPKNRTYENLQVYPQRLRARRGNDCAAPPFSPVLRGIIACSPRVDRTSGRSDSRIN
jgi:hypothetical protein